MGPSRAAEVGPERPGFRCEMTPQQIAELDAEIAAQLGSRAICDAEIDHVMADDVLLSLLEAMGFRRTVEAYKRIQKWYA